MDRRSFIQAGTLGGAAAIWGSPDDAEAAALNPEEMQQFLHRMDRGLDGITRKNTIRALGKEWRKSETTEHSERELHDDELFRKAMRSLLTVGLLHDLPEASRRHPGMQDRLWATMPDMDDAIFQMTEMMARMTPAERLDLKEAIDREPDLPMRVIEALDRESEALGISMKRRLHLRSLGTQVAFRMRQQSPSAVIDEYVGKVERMVAFHGGQEAWNRTLASAAINQSLWNSGGVGLIQGQPGGALGSSVAAAAVPAGAAVAATATAADPQGPTARTVVTKSGPIYHGLVVELENLSHITLRLATGEVRRIPWSNIQTVSAPRRPGSGEPRSFSPARTVVMKDYSIFRGDLVESLPGEFVTLQLADKTTRRIAWQDVLRILNMELDNTPWARATVESMTVVVKANGKEQRGDFFELFPGSYLAIRLPDGSFSVVATAEIQSATAVSTPSADKDLLEASEQARQAKLAKSNRVLTAGGVCLGLGIAITGTFAYLTATGNVLFSIGITFGALLLIAGLVCLIVGAAIRPSSKT